MLRVAECTQSSYWGFCWPCDALNLLSTHCTNDFQQILGGVALWRWSRHLFVKKSEFFCLFARSLRTCGPVQTQVKGSSCMRLIIVGLVHAYNIQTNELKYFPAGTCRDHPIHGKMMDRRLDGRSPRWLNPSVEILQFVRDFLLGGFDVPYRSALTAGVSAWAMLDILYVAFATRLSSNSYTLLVGGTFFNSRR